MGPSLWKDLCGGQSFEQWSETEQSMTTVDQEMAAATVTVEAYCGAWLAGDTMAVVSLYHPDLTLVWPGTHRFAGVHQGQAASLDALLGLQAATNRVPIEIRGVMTGKSAVMVVVLERWSASRDTGDRQIEILRALEYTVEHGKLRRCRIYEADQSAVDDWLAQN